MISNKKSKKIKIASILLVFTLLFSQMSFLVSANENSGSNTKNNLNNADKITKTVEAKDKNSPNYSVYYEENKDKNKDVKEIILEAENFSSNNMPELQKKDNGIITTEMGSVSYDIDVPTSGIYNIVVKYKPILGKSSNIQRAFYFNDKLPFQQAGSIIFDRVWKDENTDYKTQQGNQTFPSQVEEPVWVETFVSDAEGFFVEPFIFNLEQGKNKFTIESIQEPMEIDYIKFVKVEKFVTYEEYVNNHKAKGAKEIENASIKIQAEDAKYKSSPSLFPNSDRTSPKSEPYDPSRIVLNNIGGTSWNISGDWIEWELEVPESGFYHIGTRFKQSELKGLFSTRTLKINGQIPFKEATDIRFDYASNFQTSNFKDNLNNQDFLLYLEKGKNTLTLEVSLGAFAPIIEQVQESVVKLNRLYRDIIIVTGTKPDKYRDYNLVRIIPNMIPTIKKQLEVFKNVKKELLNITRTESEKTSVINKVIKQSEKIIENPEKIAELLESFKENISALGNWVMDMQSQPLTLDYILVTGTKDKLPKANGNFFQSIWHEIRIFLSSFTNDFSTVEKTNGVNSEKSIEVWVTTGKDQFQVIRRLVSETFEKDNNISVNLKLVGSDVLLPSTVTGKGPDVAIQIGSSTPINFAFRDAAYDISQFPDFKKVAEKFSSAALEYFKYNDAVYALPDQMSFPVMFYRTDIFNDLNFKVPETWNDLIALIPYLQQNNMDAYLETAPPVTLGSATSMDNIKAINPIYLSMLYQAGGEIYNKEGTLSNLDEQVGLDTFKFWTEFYTKHNFPLQADFVTRFRLGEVPIGIVDFTTYNRLAAAAPEIRGQWDIAPIPGTKTQSGKLKRDTPVLTSATIMIKKSVEDRNNKEEAWKFMKWWTSGDIQLKYAREMEAVLGSSGRYPVANLEAFDKMAWPHKTLKVLKDSLPHLRGVRQVPGGYITGRYLDNAFLKVVNDGENPVDTLYDFNSLIDKELYLKRKDLKLN